MKHAVVTRKRSMVRGAIAIAAFVSGCTVTPPAEQALDAPTQVVTYGGASPFPNESIKVQMLDCGTGTWVDIATSHSAAVPTGAPDVCGDRMYLWSVAVSLPPIGPSWCNNVYGFRNVTTRVVDAATGYPFRSFAKGQLCVPSAPCFRNIMRECGNADGHILNLCFPQYCYQP